MRKTILVTVMFAAMLIGVNVEAQLYNRAPSVLPGTDPAWRNPGYWVSQMEKPDEVVLTVDQIQAMNTDYDANIRKTDPFAGLSKERTPNLNHWWPGWVTPVAPDLFAMRPSEVADIVRERIGIQVKYLKDKPYGNVSAIEYSEADIGRFEHEMAIDNVPREITPLRGLVVRTTLVRNVTTSTPIEIGLQNNGERRFDMFNICLAKIGQPVTILYPSRSGEYLLVLTSDAYGWVLSSDIGISDGTGVNQFADPEEFVVCTGDKVMFYADEACTIASGWFRMGDRLPLAYEGNKRHINVPVRMMNGQLTYETAWLREDAQVHVGWLPYTRRNVVETALRLIDNPYDFTNGFFGRNHETTYRDIFACFGFKLPWHGALFTIYAGTEGVAIPDPDNDYRGKFTTILEHEPFLTLHCSGGHAQLLLGKKDGVPVVLDMHGYEYKTDDGTVYKVRRTCVGEMTNPGITGYVLRNTLTFAELK